MENEKKVTVAFAAIDKYLTNNIPSSKEGEARGKNYITWGDDDRYPNFLYQLYLDCPTLATIINGTTNFITGNGVHCNISGWDYANKKKETWEHLLQKLAYDYLTFGICYIQVIRNKQGDVCEFYYLDSRFVRSDEYNEMFFYNKEFGKRYGRSNKTIIYPKFVADAIDVPSSVICIKTPYSRGTYGIPTWGSAVKAVMIETGIDDFHLSELENNFTASAIINFNNGVPSDEDADEIEKNVREKFSGEQNAGRFVLSFNNGKDNETTVQRLGTDDFDKRYESLAKKTEKQIYTAFGCSGNLFGVPTENKGFNAEEYSQTFTIYNRTRVRPIQMQLIDAFDNVFGLKSSLIIDPFELSENNTNETNVQ